MGGTGFMIAGALLLLFATAGVVAAEKVLWNKKRRIREEIYHIYE